MLHVPCSEVPWSLLPQEMGCGCGMSCGRRLRAWQAHGVWRHVHEMLLSKLREADEQVFSHAIVDSASVRAARRGRMNRTDRRNAGSKHHIITEAQGVPLKPIVTGANRHDVTQLLPLVDGTSPIRGKC